MRLFIQTTRRIAPLCNGSPQAALSLHHIKDLILLQLHTPVQVFLDVEGVFLIIVSCVLEVRVLGQVILIREERPDTPELQDTLAAVYDGQFIPAHQLLPELLVVCPVAGTVSPGIGSIKGIDRFLAQGFCQFLQCCRLRAAKEDLAVMR